LAALGSEDWCVSDALFSFFRSLGTYVHLTLLAVARILNSFASGRQIRSQADAHQEWATARG